MYVKHLVLWPVCDYIWFCDLFVDIVGFVTCLWIIFGQNLWVSWGSLFITSFRVHVSDFAEYKAQPDERWWKRERVDSHGIRVEEVYKQILWPGSQSVIRGCQSVRLARFYNSLNRIWSFLVCKKFRCNLVGRHISPRPRPPRNYQLLAPGAEWAINDDGGSLHRKKVLLGTFLGQ